MIAWITRLLHREHVPTPELHDPPAVRKAQAATKQMEATDLRIRATLRALQEREDGGFNEHALWPDLPAYPPRRPPS